MSSALDQVKAHYNKTALAVGDTDGLDVPEWGLVVYRGPCSVGEAELIHAASYAGDVMRSHVHQVIACSRAANGDRLFKKNEADQLMESAELKVLIRVSEFVSGELDVDPRKKNGS